MVKNESLYCNELRSLQMPSSPHPSYEFIATGLAMVDASGAHVLSIVINCFKNLIDRGSS